MQAPVFGRRAAALPSLPQTAPVAPSPVSAAAVLSNRNAVSPDWAEDLFQLLFSAEGRVTRTQFRLARLAFVVADFAICQVALQSIKDLGAAWGGSVNLGFALAELAIAILALGLMLWCSSVITIKRWHDLDKSGFWSLIGLIPLVGWIGQGIMCGWISGTPGPNRYGPQPR